MSLSAIIVAHGQPSDPLPPEAEMHALAARVAGHLPGCEIRAATLAAPDALRAALQGLDEPVVFPLFMADGWFIRSLLPRALAEAGAPAARILRPFGLLPETADLAVTVLGEALAARGWAAAATTLVLAAHGSGRSPWPADAARAMQSAIALRLGFADSRLGFIEEAPELVEVAEGAGAQALCLPLFAARWGHVEEDIPAALRAAGFTGVTLPPLGSDERVPAIVAGAIAGAIAAA
ncbi:CbiX/SirB N-terminal domain-containing protein [Albidovulum sp.]|uniref:CbiX/SirB N-terminal domain-containing protein n=1 Tax=Albidovulum sp. TaxID=1872424 RepID=UPI0039B9710E